MSSIEPEECESSKKKGGKRRVSLSKLSAEMGINYSGVLIDSRVVQPIEHFWPRAT